ncbi:unnamed protein product, partial [Schistosoma spindalis]
MLSHNHAYIDSSREVLLTASRDGGVVHENGRTKSECPVLEPDPKPMVHMGSSIRREQMAYEPIVGHRLPWDCISLRCSTTLWVRRSGQRLR